MMKTPFKAHFNNLLVASEGDTFLRIALEFTTRVTDLVEHPMLSMSFIEAFERINGDYKINVKISELALDILEDYWYYFKDNKDDIHQVLPVSAATKGDDLE